jgi:dethiobiotin synthetase
MNRQRPPVLVVVAGTGTEVGKTFVACSLARELRRRGLAVAARKPAQSFEPPATPGTTDAELLAGATGENVSDVCPSWRWYARAMAPPMAAESMGEKGFLLRDLAGELAWPPSAEVGIVELAGGLGSPQALDGDGVDLVELLAPDLVVLVAEAGLGKLSAISLSARALGSRPLVVYINRFDGGEELHRANRRWVEERFGLEVCLGPGELAGAVARRLGGGR